MAISHRNEFFFNIWLNGDCHLALLWKSLIQDSFKLEVYKAISTILRSLSAYPWVPTWRLILPETSFHKNKNAPRDVKCVSFTLLSNSKYKTINKNEFLIPKSDAGVHRYMHGIRLLAIPDSKNKKFQNRRPSWIVFLGSLKDIILISAWYALYNSRRRKPMLAYCWFSVVDAGPTFSQHWWCRVRERSRFGHQPPLFVKGRVRIYYK